jgi:hypothetical protein
MKYKNFNQPFIFMVIVIVYAFAHEPKTVIKN